MPELEEGLGLAGLGLAPKEYKFFGGSVSLFYDDAEHEYTRFDAAGNLYIVPGVTSAIHIIDKSDALTQWAANQATEYVESKVAEERVKFFEIAAACGDVLAPDTQVQIEASLVLSWLNDARFAFRKYKEAAADTGKIAHDWVEQYIRSLIHNEPAQTAELLANLPEDERARNGALAALDWMTKHKVRWVCTERKIYSRDHDYAGTLDGLAYISSCGDPECCGRTNMETGEKEAVFFENVLCMIDWKTSNRLYAEYEYQTAAYLKQQQEERGYVIPLRFIIRLGKDDAQFEARLLFEDTIERDFHIFLECLALYRSIEGRKRGERAVRDILKALFKAQKEAAIAAEKAEKKAKKDLLKFQKASMFEDLRRRGFTIKAARAAIKEAFAAQPNDDEEIVEEAIAA
jgi:hypothetical protein